MLSIRLGVRKPVRHAGRVKAFVDYLSCRLASDWRLPVIVVLNIALEDTLALQYSVAYFAQGEGLSKVLTVESRYSWFMSNSSSVSRVLKMNQLKSLMDFCKPPRKGWFAIVLKCGFAGIVLLYLDHGLAEALKVYDLPFPQEAQGVDDAGIVGEVY